ncbi:hypothetical protein D018_3177 [Vibrio parahaemolyticus VP2007-007]|nr:hypothetical protein D018_3177 [Vibrio parahaemolyticus VP2007-007]
MSQNKRFNSLGINLSFYVVRSVLFPRVSYDMAKRDKQ